MDMSNDSRDVGIELDSELALDLSTQDKAFAVAVGLNEYRENKFSDRDIDLDEVSHLKDLAVTRYEALSEEIDGSKFTQMSPTGVRDDEMDNIIDDETRDIADSFEGYHQDSEVIGVLKHEGVSSFVIQNELGSTFIKPVEKQELSSVIVI